MLGGPLWCGFVPGGIRQKVNTESWGEVSTRFFPTTILMLRFCKLLSPVEVALLDLGVRTSASCSARSVFDCVVRSRCLVLCYPNLRGMSYMRNDEKRREGWSVVLLSVYWVTK